MNNILNKNDVVTVTIEDVNINGEGIGRYGGVAVFVPSTAIGDILQVKVIKEAKKYFVGKIEKIISASKDRITPDCPVYKRCGGCVFRHISYEAELKIKRKHVADCLARIGGFKNIDVDSIIGAKNILHYRNKMQLPIGYDKENNLISGLYTSRSHEIINMSSCLLQPEEFDKIVQEVKKWMVKYNISAYSEVLCKGDIRHIYIRCSKNLSEIMLCLVAGSKKISHTEDLVKSIISKFTNVKSIAINYNLEKTNVILGEKFETIYGKDYITDDLCGLKFNISPESFYQVNHDQTEVLYTLAKKLISFKKGENLIDLYCGIGTIGLSVSDKSTKLYGAEIVKKAIENAKENARLNGFDNAEFICGDSSKIIKKYNMKNVNTVVVDPPRKGCSESLIDDLKKLAPEKIVYISCNPATLAKNLKQLCTDKYKIERVIPVDMFPRTAHVETVCLLLRVKI